jgi:hypothetical protein
VIEHGTRRIRVLGATGHQVASTATALAACRASHTASLLAFEHAHLRAYKNTVTSVLAY